MVRFLRDGHMSNAPERTTDVLMIMMHRTCAPVHHSSAGLLPCVNDSMWTWHHIFKWTANVYFVNALVLFFANITICVVCTLLVNWFPQDILI